MKRAVLASTVFGASVLRAAWTGSLDQYWSWWLDSLGTFEKTSSLGKPWAGFGDTIIATVTGQSLSQVSSTGRSGVLLAAILVKVLHTVLFGPLRVDEVERLMGQAWYTVVEFGVAFLIVHEPLTARTLCTAGVFLLLKWFHSLSSSRVMDFNSSGGTGQYARFQFWRLALVVFLLHVNDIIWMKHYYTELFVLRDETTGNIFMSTTIFAVELSVLYTSLLATTAHLIFLPIYTDSASDSATASYGSSTKRQIYLSVVNILSELFKLTIYMGFSMVMLSNYCLPLHIFREAYMTLRLSIQKIRALIWHKHILGQYDVSSFQPARSMDFEENSPCVICRDPMVLGEAEQKTVRTKCGHAVHYECLFEWLQRSCCCPTCRATI